MIIKETIVKVIDNSGAKTAKCIGFHKGRTKVAGIGDTIVVSVQRHSSHVTSKKHLLLKDKKVARGDVCLAVVVQVRQATRRLAGYRVCFQNSAVVLVTDKGIPRATRILGLVAADCGNLKILSLAKNTA